jgi:hypothetical protein
MTKFSISTPKNYTKNGEQKTFWLEVGTMIKTDDGRTFIELNMFPNQTFMANEIKPSNKTNDEVQVNF